MLYERIFLLMAITLAIVFLLGGYILASWSGNPEWVCKSGAGIVASEIIVVIVEHKRRARFEKISLEVRHTNKFVPLEIERAEKNIFYVGASLVAIGELIHGFGDVIFEWLTRG